MLTRPSCTENEQAIETCKMDRCKYFNMFADRLLNGDKSSYKGLPDQCCKSSGVVYSFQCRGCDKLYIGKTQRRLHRRIYEHIRVCRRYFQQISTISTNVYIVDTILRKDIEAFLGYLTTAVLVCYWDAVGNGISYRAWTLKLLPSRLNWTTKTIIGIRWCYICKQVRL